MGWGLVYLGWGEPIVYFLVLTTASLAVSVFTLQSCLFSAVRAWCPVSSVINDVQKSRPSDILVQEDGSWIVKGSGRKVHIIESDGEVVTSFYNPKANTDNRIKKGEWQRPSNEQLDDFKEKFSDYIKW